ncbi:MAG: phage tail domain-containing protein [Leuconostoc pseudomesenteroides]|uniref:phage tail domain-containing protein n=1 Tax=Leuconostoc pseudomesenteroides TaxID=33968 RepID=UPI0039EB7C38
MDLLITNGTASAKLSDKGIVTTDFDESTASLSLNTKSFTGRNGKLNFGGNYSEKKLTYTGYMQASSQSDYEAKRNWLYQLLGSATPYYITPIYSDLGQYDFERPGQSTGNRLGQTGGTESNKRFLVTLDDTFAPEFSGSVNSKQNYKLSISFVTAVLPFGETKPKTATVTSTIPYAGTVTASQLEVPFYILLTAKQTASAISLKIGSKTWTYSGTVASGDVFKIGGVYNLKNTLSINDNTNLEYFVLEPSTSGTVAVTCSITATIEIHDYKELYL